MTDLSDDAREARIHAAAKAAGAQIATLTADDAEALVTAAVLVATLLSVTGMHRATFDAMIDTAQSAPAPGALDAI